MKEHILTAAINALHNQTGLTLEVLQREYVFNNQGQRIDALLKLQEQTILKAEIKDRAANINTGALINQQAQLGERGEVILLADYVNPKLAERLRKLELQFMDTAGNAYLNTEGIFVYIKGNRPETIQETPTLKTGRAFQQTGLKVIYQFLKDKQLINAPYREIAEKAGVALGTIVWVMRDLIQQGYLKMVLGKKEKAWADYAGLFDKWVEEYPYKLREKHKLGAFVGDERILMEMDIHEFGALWGGEKAAAKYTNYLTPKDYLIYTHQEKLRDLLTYARLRKRDNHDKDAAQVDIFEIFWRKQPAYTLEEYTDPLITYADLVATGEPRNLETAQRLRENIIG